MFYRVKQFIKAVTARVTDEEMEWVKGYLSKKEWQLFMRLKVYEQRHCIDVAKLLKEWTKGEREMIRLGLLHDIGKIQYPLNPIEKSMIVVLDKITKGTIQKWYTLKMVQCYYHHPQMGYEQLSALETYEVWFLESIRNHHNALVVDERTRLLQQADSLC